MPKTYRVAYTINAKDFAREYHWRAERARMTLQSAAQYNAALLVAKAQEFSSSDCHTLADLRRMGHPYAKRAPNPPHPIYMIHKQRGRFFAAWYSKVVNTPDGVQVILGNTARVRGWSLLGLLDKGTKLMIARLIMPYTLAAVRKEMELNNRRAYRSAVGLHGAAARSRASAYLAGLKR